MLTRSLSSSEYKTDGNTLVGYASVWGVGYRMVEPVNGQLRSFTESVRKGAFSRSLASSPDIVSFYNHSPNHLLGRTSNKTLRVEEDAHGLRFEVDLPDTPTGNEVRALAQRGDLSGASFTFGIRPNGEKWEGNKRELTDLFLAEVGPVVLPASAATEVQMRSTYLFKRLALELKEKKV